MEGPQRVAAGPTGRPLSRSTVTAGLALGVAAVSISAILARVAMGDGAGVASADAGRAPPLAIAFWRTAAGALVLALFARRALLRDGVRLRTHAWPLVGSGVALAVHFALFIGSLAFTTVASSVTLVTASPLFVALGAWWFLDERLSRRTAIGMATTMAGALTIGLADAGAIDLGPRALAGDAMALGGAVAVSAYLLLGRAVRAHVPSTAYSAAVFGAAAFVLLGSCLVLGAPLAGYGGVTWLAITGIVIGPQLLGHTVFNALLSEVSPTVVAVVVLAEPVASTLLAWAILGELPATLFWVGAPLVLMGVGVAATRFNRRDEITEEAATTF